LWRRFSLILWTNSYGTRLNAILCIYLASISGWTHCYFFLEQSLSRSLHPWRVGISMVESGSQVFCLDLVQVLFDCCLKHGKPFQFLYLLVHVQILNYHSCEWVFSSVHTKQFLTLSMFYYRCIGILASCF
jgi:hypothetical protein